MNTTSMGTIRRKSAWLAGAGALVCTAMVPVHAAAPDKLYAMLAPSVWQVVALNQDRKPFMQGSAVVIAPEVLLTNCHVLKGAKSFFVTHDKRALPAHLQYADPERDMCQVVANELKAPAVHMGDSDQIAVGQRIYALGNPMGLELTLSDGLVSGLRRDRQQRLHFIQISAPISHGSSGGGVFDASGRLLGITTALVQDGQNLNLAIPVAWQRDLPTRSRDAYAANSSALRAANLPPADGKPSAAALAVAAAPDADARRPASSFVHATAPVASGYANIDEVDKLVALEPGAGKSYEQFLQRPFPRAFALAAGGGSYVAWTDRPKVPGDDPDPAVRVLTRCEAQYHRTCALYAVDDVVVYRKPGRHAGP
jgi:serine protease Do